MPLYQVNSRQTGAQQSITTTFKTVIAITSATGALRRGKCMEIIYGADGAPNATDCQIVYDVSRQTAAGTSTVATPTPVDPNDVAAGSIANINFSVEGTVTASSSVWESSLNQRASQRTHRLAMHVLHCFFANCYVD